jgi:hypothetical protein
MRAPRLALIVLLPLALAACGGGAKKTAPKPADRHLVYVAGDTPATANVWIADVNGRHPRRLTRGAEAVLSPDGRTVAVERRSGIYLVSSRGGHERHLTSKRLQPRGWSPDGKKIVATAATQTAVVALDLVDRRSGRTRVLARGSLYGFDFSPKGDELVYARAPKATESGICGDLIDLYVAKLTGGKPTQLTHNGYSAFPVWGKSIAFSRFPQSFNLEDCAAPGIWTVDPSAGSKPQPIIARAPSELSVSGDYGLQPLAWLDDNHVLAGIRTDFGTQGAVLDTRTKKLRQLGDSFADEVSNDGRYVVGSGGSDQLELTITRVSDGKRIFRRENACCPDWNR